MKYGDSLQQRSIPEWGTYNIDYNDIKHLIKVRTTKSKARAIPIPGQDVQDPAHEAFEDELYTELLAQHQRIDLFVKSKSGEIKRRLDHLQVQIFALTQRFPTETQKRISVRRLERFSKAEGEVLKVGDEVQSLARFVGAQRLAFTKLLKKYKKWTGSSSLQIRFDREVPGKPLNFTQRDFGSLLEQWTDVLAAVRAPFEAGLSWKAKADDDIQWESGSTRVASGRNVHDPISPQTMPDESLGAIQTAKSLDSIYKMGSDVDVDTAFATLALGSSAGKAVYWVHPDNIIQLHILLLQHTRLRRRKLEHEPSQTPPSSRSSRQGSTSGSVTGRAMRIDDEATIIICDDLQAFAKRRNGTTVSEIETLPGSIPEEAAASIRYSSSKGEATIAICDYPQSPDQHPHKIALRGVRRAKMKRKALGKLFFRESSTPSSPIATITTQEYESAQPSENEADSIRRWLYEHDSVRPLVRLQCNRSRFVGLGNNALKGVWVALDKDVYMTNSSYSDLQDLGQSSATRLTGLVAFPHAVLEVRWEGSCRPDLVKALDESHLTERVRGFSLETHAVATICKPSDMAVPFWVPALNRDIRKVPARAKSPVAGLRSTGNRDSSETTSNGASTPSPTSTTDLPSSSGFSAAPQPESPATSVPDLLEAAPLKAFKKKRRVKRESSHHGQMISSNRTSSRYWNEFDDGDEAPADQTYTILVDPNAPSTFPGGALLSQFVTVISGKAKSSSEKVYAWLRPPAHGRTDERQPLNSGYFTQRPTAEDPSLDSDIDSDNSSVENVPQARQYFTLPRHQRRVRSPILDSRERLLFRCCVGSFLASLTFLAIASVLALTTRKRYIVTADIGTIVGVVASLVFAAVGMGMMVGRKGDVGWVHRSLVLSVFAGVCTGNLVLISVVAGFSV